MARNALGDAAENLVGQRAGEVAHLVRADTNAVARPDEHRGVSGDDALHTGYVHADLIHAHDPDDGASSTANPDVSSIGQRPRQTLTVADGRGGDPALGGGSPGPPVADALTAGDRPHLRDTAEHVHRRSERYRAGHRWVAVEGDARAH